MDLPELSIIVITFRRPWYALLTLEALSNHLIYDGPRKFIISDGGSPEWNLEMYRDILRYQNYEIIVDPSGSVSNQMNNAVAKAGEVWIMTLDDFYPRVVMDVTNDVRFLQQNEDIGHLRYGNLNNWDVPQLKVYAELRNIYREHYWVMDKARSGHGIMWTMGFSMMHRRMWDAYGPIEYVPPHQPGRVEDRANNQFWERSGPSVAVPMRLGQESSMKLPLYQPIAHIGHVRTDEYTAQWGQRWGAT